YYMVPRYIRVMDDLPKAPTQKVQKFQLRAEGVTGDTWDREAAGIQVRRDKLTPAAAAG
ncbi:MAG: ATP-dependent acyl-CoA ligase, partial [Comamonadaceae bacterium]